MTRSLVRCFCGLLAGWFIASVALCLINPHCDMSLHFCCLLIRSVVQVCEWELEAWAVSRRKKLCRLFVGIFSVGLEIERDLCRHDYAFGASSSFAWMNYACLLEGPLATKSVFIMKSRQLCQRSDHKSPSLHNPSILSYVSSRYGSETCHRWTR